MFLLIAIDPASRR